MPQIRPILLFDLGGVLIESDMFTELRRLTGSAHSEAELISHWLANPVARAFELGRCTPADFSHSIVREFRLSMAPDDFLSAFATWPKGFYPGVEALLAELRQSHTVCCLSNSNEVHWTNAPIGHFDHAFSSHLIGCIKPDRDAFDHVLSTLGATPGDVHFFDDAPVNVEAARACGLHAHHTPGFTALQTKLHDLHLRQ
jgi:putative hydrolase of the HAD superfamily